MSVLNTFLRYLGHRDWQVDEFVRVSGDVQPELTRAEYLRLLSAAKHIGKEKTYLLIKTMGGAGVRVQELSQVTVEAVHQGMVKLDSHNGLRLHPCRCKTARYRQYCRCRQGREFTGCLPDMPPVCFFRFLIRVIFLSAACFHMPDSPFPVSLPPEKPGSCFIFYILL